MAIERDSLMREIRLETDLTRPFLRRLREADLSWTPDPESWSLGQLAAHLAVIPSWGLAILRFELHDMSTASGWTAPDEIDLAAIETSFENHMTELVELVASTELTSIWTFVRGTEVIVALPKASAIRHYVLGHLAHHRGQLAVYLRMSGCPVPASYGSSKQEAPASLI